MQKHCITDMFFISKALFFRQKPFRLLYPIGSKVVGNH